MMRSRKSMMMVDCAPGHGHIGIMKSKLFAIVVMVFALLSLPVMADDPKSPEVRPEKIAAKLVNPAEAEKLIADKKVTVLDVRTPEEFASGHIAGAVNLNLNGKDFSDKLEKLDKSKPYLVNCAVGMRSAKACKKMNELQFKTLYDLQGGINAWKKDGKPVTKEAAK